MCHEFITGHMLSCGAAPHDSQVKAKLPAKEKEKKKS
jgi:hypothetical protein